MASGRGWTGVEGRPPVSSRKSQSWGSSTVPLAQRVPSHASESELQTVCLPHEVSNAGVDILEAGPTCHQFGRVSRAYCAARSKVSARTSDPVRGALESGGVAGRHTESDFGKDAGNLRPEYLRELPQQALISFESGQNAFHVKGRLGHWQHIRTRRRCARRDARERLDERKELSRVNGL